MNFQPTIDAMSACAQTFSCGDTREKLHAVQAAQDALDAVKAVLLADLEATREFELDGASTLNMWVRNQLRVNAGQATKLVRNVHALRDLPLVDEAARAGLINTAHVQAFVYGLRHVGLQTMRLHEEALVALACDREPDVLFEMIKYLKDKIDPEDLDEKWRDGMDKEDFTIDALPDGFHTTGFLNTTTGLKFKTVLDSISAPRDDNDPRTGAQRRVQGLDDLLTAILANGLPSDKGVTPHMNVFADADTLQAAAQRVQQDTEDPNTVPDPMPPTEPARLAGHGNIGPHLLMYFWCISDFTAFLMKQHGGARQAEILNVGRTHRLATHKQRRAARKAEELNQERAATIGRAQRGRRPGEARSDEVAGAASAASRAPHHLLHAGKLHISGNAIDGFTFTNRTGRPLRRRRRTSYRDAA